MGKLETILRSEKEVLNIDPLMYQNIVQRIDFFVFDKELKRVILKNIK